MYCIVSMVWMRTLKSVGSHFTYLNLANDILGLSEICPSCNSELNPQENGRCVYCDRLSEKTKCSICRLPVKGEMVLILM